MGLKVRVAIDGDPMRLVRRDIEAGERAVTQAMRGAARDIKQVWRGQITGAGMGRRLGNTVRAAAYPQGENSMDAAALIWTNAPKIVAAHNEGALIRSSAGFWLAIPLPAAGRARGGRRTTPYDFEKRTGQKLRFIYRQGSSALLVVDDARVTKRGQARRKGGRRRKDGILTGAQTVPVFVLVPQAKLRKKFDLQAGAMGIANGVPQRIVDGLGD